jgi:hypothetical protein
LGGDKGTRETATPPSIDILRQLLRIERYEVSAMARRGRAMRAFLVFQPAE